MKEERENVRKLMVSINRIDGIWYRLARRSGLKENTLSLLLALDDGRPRTQKQICEEWMIPKTTINTIVKECMAAGYVEFCPEGNSREKLLRLTKKGLQYAKQALELFYRTENAAMKRTLEECSPEFIRAVELYACCLKEEADRQGREKEEERCHR